MAPEIAASRPLQKMFMEVPGRYDKMNRLLTWRLDELWRKKIARRILENNPSRVLDLCTGTGDLILHLAKNAENSVKLTGLDYSKPMLRIAKEKSSKYKNIEFIYGDVASMPFPDNYFDAIGIAFAFRNLIYKNKDSDKFMNEMIRILNKDGKLFIVETSQTNNILLKAIFRLYMNLIVAGLGSWISRNKSAYKYLARSAINFYNQKEVKKLLFKTGFAEVESKALLGGVAAIYIAKK